MQINCYLNFKGECEAALKFYEQALGANVHMLMRFGDSPMAAEVSPEWKDKVVHARCTIGETILMASDAPPDRYVRPQGFSVNLGTATAEEAERAFAALSAGGKVEMPLQPTFWATRFGIVTDRFGTPWMVNCEIAP